jgi:DNA-binding LytR/AlgR family response regulator
MIKAIIIDDEPIAREIIRNYCIQSESILVIAECTNAMGAIKVLNENTNIDLLFLDINMPKLNGLAMLKTLTKKPKVIITTAYKEYALDAFELHVCDYLLKPFSFERFISAIQKVQLELGEVSKTDDATISISTEEFDGIFLKIGKVIYRYAFNTIIFLEAQQNYTRIVTNKDDVKVYQPLSKIEEKLPTQFIRCHRSYIVNKNFISKIDGNVIVLENYEVTIAPNQKEMFLERLGL